MFMTRREAYLHIEQFPFDVEVALRVDGGEILAHDADADWVFGQGLRCGLEVLDARLEGRLDFVARGRCPMLSKKAARALSTSALAPNPRVRQIEVASASRHSTTMLEWRRACP